MMKIATIVLLGLAVGAEAGRDTPTVVTTTADTGRGSTTTPTTTTPTTTGRGTTTPTTTTPTTTTGRPDSTSADRPDSTSSDRPDSTTDTRSDSTTTEEEEGAIVYTPAAEEDMTCKNRCWQASNRYQQSAAPAVYASSCDTVDNGPRTVTTVDSDRTTTTTPATTTTGTTYVRTDTNTNCKYYTLDSNNNKVCWTGSVNGVANAGRRLLQYATTGSTTQSGCTSTESVNEAGNRVVTTRCTGNTTGTNYGNTGTTTGVSSRTCTQEDFDVQTTMVAASQAKYDLWRASADRNAAVINYNSHSGYCSCDTLCVTMGDCCDDMGYWCTTGDTMKTMTVSQHYYDFPYPGTMHFAEETEVEEETGTTVTTPTTTQYYIMVDGVRQPYYPSGTGTTVTTPTTTTPTTTVTTPTTTTGRNCYTRIAGCEGDNCTTPVACPTNTGTTSTTGTTTTRACSRYTLNDDGTKNCLN